MPLDVADATILAPILTDMDAHDLFNDANAPGAWTLDLIRRRQAGAITRRQGAAAQRYIMATIGVPDRSTQWAILNATDVLPAVDVSSLTPYCLNVMLRVAATLRSGVFARLWTTPGALATAAAARRTAVTTECQPTGVDWGVFIDRATAQLGSYLQT